jgi:hypothetical protein
MAASAIDYTTAPVERLEFADRYYIQTAKSAIESLTHIAEEVISNEDEAISRRASRDGLEDEGTIVVHYDPDEMMLTVAGDGDGMTAATMRSRLKLVGASPEKDAKRGFFHRGIREVFLAMGGGEISSIGIDDYGRQVLSKAVFGSEPGMRIVVEDQKVSAEERAELGLTRTGTVVRIPMRRFATKKPRMFEFAQVETQIRDCVGLRPVLTDPKREVHLEYGDEPRRSLRFQYPAGEALVVEHAIEVGGEAGTFWARLTDKPVKRGGGRGRRTRIAGILVRGERAAYEVSLGDEISSHPGMARVVGELRIDGIERLQRQADAEADDESQLVYKTDRSGLNPEHPLVERIHGLIDRTIGPLIAEVDSAEEKKQVTPDMRRELQKLARVINEAIKGVTTPELDDTSGEQTEEAEKGKTDKEPPEPPKERTRYVEDGIGFAYDRIFLEAGKSRTVKVWFDAAKIPPGTPVTLASSPDEVIIGASLSRDVVPAPASDGVAELELTIKAGSSEGRHEVVVASEDWEATLPVHVRFPRASGFISQIIPENLDWEAGSALWDPSSGVVRVFIGRPEFKDAEARARRAGESDPWKHAEYRQLVVESVREAALWPAAARRAEVEWDELPAEDRRDGSAFHKTVQYEFQALDYLLRGKLLKAFAQS